MKNIKAKTWADIPKNFTGIVEWLNEDKSWFKEGKLHREDGPAVELADGSKFWYKENKFHREDGPAVELADGTKNWYLEDRAYKLINLKDYLILDYSEGEYGIMWYKLLNQEEIFEYPDIPGLITK